jgi:hypothetical protein
MKRFPASLGILALVAAAITSGCTKNQEDTSNSASAQTPAVEKPRFETIVIPEGTHVVASLDRRLSTETNHDGDPFVATTTEPVIVDGRTVLPAGAQVRGELRGVQASGRIKGRAQMTLAYQEIVDSQGSTHAIFALPLTLRAASAAHGDVEKIAAGGVLGALIGGITGGGKGAAIGAGAGAGAGTVLMLATKGSDLELEPGRRLTVRTTAPTSIPVLAQK